MDRRIAGKVEIITVIMLKIAIIQFPGINTEYETRREINRCGMRGEFFRWNDDPRKLASCDGYVIGGGFAYEDRGRAGIIASLDPLMKTIKKEAAKGKPVLGICNGAQILVESGLIPGTDDNKLAMALARNKRIRDGEVLGTGYYNVWINIKCTAKQENCMFTRNIKEGEILKAPIAHGEGRFTTEIQELMPQLLSKGQIVFRYCDKNGVIIDNFPVNPNGSMFNAAAICNPAGNVMAIMPHLERAEIASEKLFASMRDSILESKKTKKRVHHLNIKTPRTWPLPACQLREHTMQWHVSLIITDNEAETFELTLKNLGWQNVRLGRATHIEIEYKGKPNLQKLARKLIQSGVLINTNKERVTIQFRKQQLSFNNKSQKFTPVAVKTEESQTFRLLVREKPDFVGLAKTSAIQKRLKFEEIMNVNLGKLWTIQIPTKSKAVAEKELKRMMATHLFFNPHRQEAFIIA